MKQIILVYTTILGAVNQEWIRSPNFLPCGATSLHLLLLLECQDAESLKIWLMWFLRVLTLYLWHSVSLEAGGRKRRQRSLLACWQGRQCSSLFRIIKYLETTLFFGERDNMGTCVIVGFQFCPVDFPLKCEREMILCFTPYIRYQNDTQRWISEGYVVQSFLPADLTLLLLPLKGSRKGGTFRLQKAPC